MTKDEFISEIKRIVDFQKTIPEDFQNATVAIDICLYGHPRMHFQHIDFVNFFPEFESRSFNGKHVELYAEVDGLEIFCLYPIIEFVENFGACRLPKK